MVSGRGGGGGLGFFAHFLRIKVALCQIYDLLNQPRDDLVCQSYDQVCLANKIVSLNLLASFSSWPLVYTSFAKIVLPHPLAPALRRFSFSETL